MEVIFHTPNVFSDLVINWAFSISPAKAVLFQCYLGRSALNDDLLTYLVQLWSQKSTTLFHVLPVLNFRTYNTEVILKCIKITLGFSCYFSYCFSYIFNYPYVTVHCHLIIQQNLIGAHNRHLTAFNIEHAPSEKIFTKIAYICKYSTYTQIYTSYQYSSLRHH